MKHWFERAKTYARNNKFIVILTGAFLAAQMIMIHFHEMWRDEIQAWSIARSSHSLLDLYHNLHYEGHPALWHFILFIVSRFTGNPVAMQVVHVLIATAVVFMIVRYSPFTRLHKALLSFSYFLFYEYGVIARNYSLGVLVVFLFCILMTRAKKNYLYIGITLALLAQTNPMNALLVPVLGLYVLFDALPNLFSKRVNIKELIVCGGLTVLGLGVFYLQVKQPQNSGIGTFVGPDIRYALATIWQAYAPIPARVVSFWSTNVLTSSDQVILLSISMLVVMTLYFSRNVKVLLTYLLGTATLVGFYNQKNLGSLRHQGMLFILLIVCFWLTLATRTKSSKDRGLRVYQYGVLTILLCVQVFATLGAVNKDVKLIFSRAKESAHYIKSNPSIASLPIAGDADYVVTPVVGYLDKTAYYPGSNTRGTFIRWIKLDKLSQQETLRRVHERTKTENSDMLFVTNYKIESQNMDGIRELKEFSGPTVVADEQYFMYVVSKTK